MDGLSVCVQTVQMMLCKWLVCEGCILGVEYIGLQFWFCNVALFNKFFCCSAWTMALQDARINAVSLPSDCFVSFCWCSLSAGEVISLMFLFLDDGFSSDRLCTGSDAICSSSLLRICSPTSGKRHKQHYAQFPSTAAIIVIYIHRLPYWGLPGAGAWTGLNGSLVLHQVYAQGPYGDYVAPPPHVTQIVYSADGQPYTVAYPYQYQGKYFCASGDTK